MIASVVALSGFIHVADLFDKLPHTFDHMGRVNDFRPSAEAANPGVEHVADFHFRLGSEVGVIYLLVFHTRNSKLVNYGVKALVYEADGYTLTLAAEHGEDSLGIVLHVHILFELLLPFPCGQEFLHILHAVNAVDNGFCAVVGQQIEETIVNQHLVRVHNVELLRSEKATGGVESYTVSIGKEIIDELEGVYFGCYNEGDAYMYGTYLIKNDLKTDGVPKGMEEVLRYRTDGQITIYEATAQLLDNGYVRYNIDFSASKGRLISFFDPPNGNCFMRIRYSETTGERETIAVDIKQEDNNAISTITMNFYEGNKDSAWVFINTVHF